MLKADFEYLRLYEFSPSLGACVRDGRDGVANLSSRPPSTQQRADWEFSPESPAYYLEQAIEAAEALLRLLLNFHFPATQRTLRYASSRHYMKIVFAAVFLIQVLRSGIPSSDYQTILVSTLKETVLTLESCSIDVAHPAFRYSILLRGLMAETQRRQESLTPSPLSLTIGPRDCRRTHAVANAASGEGRPGSSQANSTGDQRSGVDADNAAPFMAGRASRGPQHEDGRQASESTQWLAENEFSTNWEDSLEFLDGDTFLQSLIGIDFLN